MGLFKNDFYRQVLLRITYPYTYRFVRRLSQLLTAVDTPEKILGRKETPFFAQK